MGSEHGSFTSRHGDSFTAAASPWSQVPPGYFSPMSVQYVPQPQPQPHPMYYTHSPHGPYQPAPMPQILPQNSYLIDDHATGEAPSDKKKAVVVTSLPTLSVFSVLALVVVSILTIVRDHEDVSVTLFWLFALGGIVACALAFTSSVWGHKAEVLGRIGLFLAACGCGASSAYWFTTKKEGVGVLMGGQAILCLLGLFCGSSWAAGRSGYRPPREDFSFAQSLLGAGHRDYHIGH